MCDNAESLPTAPAKEDRLRDGVEIPSISRFLSTSDMADPPNRNRLTPSYVHRSS